MTDTTNGILMSIVLVLQIKAKSSAVHPAPLHWCYEPRRGKAWRETKRIRWGSTLGVIETQSIGGRSGAGTPSHMFLTGIYEMALPVCPTPQLNLAWQLYIPKESKPEARSSREPQPSRVHGWNPVGRSLASSSVHTASVFRMKRRHVRNRLLLTCSSELGFRVKEIPRHGSFSLNIDILGHSLHTFVKWLHNPASG